MKRHILLIDTDKHELDYFMDALKQVPEDDGFKCTYAGTVMQAVYLLERLVPHFIFIDKAMPSRDIIYILQRVREALHLRDVKVFFYGRQDDEPNHPEIPPFGVNGYVKRSRSSGKLGRQLADCLAE